ncbi:MAG: hypothetical protein WBE38_10675, partial [Terracidiphilus sp.]
LYFTDSFLSLWIAISVHGCVTAFSIQLFTEATQQSGIRRGECHFQCHRNVNMWIENALGTFPLRQ